MRCVVEAKSFLCFPFYILDRKPPIETSILRPESADADKLSALAEHSLKDIFGNCVIEDVKSYLSLPFWDYRIASRHPFT